MKKQVIALAVLGLVSGLTAAQSSVTVYGTVDLGLLTQNHAANNTQLYNGGIAPSIWGFRGARPRLKWHRACAPPCASQAQQVKIPPKKPHHAAPGSHA